MCVGTPRSVPIPSFCTGRGTVARPGWTSVDIKKDAVVHSARVPAILVAVRDPGGRDAASLRGWWGESLVSKETVCQRSWVLREAVSFPSLFLAMSPPGRMKDEELYLS